MVAEAEFVCQKSVPVLDVQYISSAQTVRFLISLIRWMSYSYGLLHGN